MAIATPTATIFLPYHALDDVIQRGTRAAQPAASAVVPGTLYSVTDEASRLERSDGTAWALYAPTASGGGAPAAHHVTHEPGGSDALVNAAWTSLANVFTAAQRVETTAPTLVFNDTDQPANQKRWDVWTNSGTFYILPMTDAGGTVVQGVRIDRQVNLTIDGSLTATGATLSGDVRFVPDALVDIGPSGGSRPRDLFLARHLTAGGLLTVNGFGPHSVSAGGAGEQALTVENPISGAANLASLRVDASTTGVRIHALSPGYASTGPYVADGGALLTTGSGGWSLGAMGASGVIRFYAAGIERMRLHGSGGLSLGSVNDPGASVLNCGGSTGPYLLPSGLYMNPWPTTAAAANAVVTDADTLRRVTSVRAAKQDIRPIPAAEARRVVQALQSVTYRSRVDADQRAWPGFIAEDVAACAAPLAVYGPDGQAQAVAYDRIAAYLVPVVQDLAARLAALEARRADA